MSAGQAGIPPVQARVSRVIVVFGTKGGVGKTTVATNLAVSLTHLAKSVCLLDLDVLAVGDVCRMLNLEAPRYLVELVPALKRAPLPAPTSVRRMSGPGRQAGLPLASSLDGLVAPHSSGVHVVSCLSNPRQINQLDPKVLPGIFQALKSRYEYLIVDAGRAFTDALVTAFEEANLILMVLTPDVVSLYQTNWAIETIGSLQFPIGMVKVVLNRAESRGGVETRDIETTLPCQVISRIPSEGKVVGMALNQGLPVVLATPSSRVAMAIRQLAELLVARPELFVERQAIPRRQTPQEVLSHEQVWSSRLPALTPADVQAGLESDDEIIRLKRRVHEGLVEKLDLKKLDLAALAHTAQAEQFRERTEQMIATLLAQEAGGVISSQEVRLRLVKEIADEALGLGPLEELLADPEVTDILVNNKDQIYIERGGKLELTTKRFTSDEQVRVVIERIVAPLGRRIDEANPMVDARLPDGSRVNAIIPPLSITGPVLSIRKFARTRYTQEDLIQFGSLTPAMAHFIKACVLARKNMVISGGTGSGKTTLLNVVSAFIPEGERIITIEDAAELKLAQTHWVSLEARLPNIEGRGQVASRDLFRNALRMRPDRIIIGECRGAETLDMLQAMNTGHDGSITTVHANAPRDVISRLDSMVLMSNIDLPVRAIREMVSSAIDVIIHTARLSDGSRKITAITELIGLVHEAEIAFQDLFVFRQTGVAPDGTVLGEFVTTGKLPTFLDELKVKGIELDELLFSPAVKTP